MIKFFLVFIILILLNNCSFDTRSGIWTKPEILDTQKVETEILFEKKQIIKKEFNSNFTINTPLKLFKNQTIAESNNENVLNLKKISKYKFSRINSFKYFDPTLIFYYDDLIFFDKKGSVIRFDETSKILWKKNYYTKNEKKSLPILNLSIKDNIIIVTDSLSKYYAIDVKTGKLIWSKNHNTTFISDVKIDKNRFYIVDSNNALHCFSLIDGSKIWEFDSDYELIKSQKKLSIILDEEKIYFNNSKGDIYSLNKDNGNLVWITPSKNPNEISQTFLLKTSELVKNNTNIYFSNNQNSFFSIDKKTGFINWQQDINSEIKPIIVDNFIFTISTDGYLFIIDKVSGNILRITDLFVKFNTSPKKYNPLNIFTSSEKKGIRKLKFKPVGFELDVNNIYLSLDNGKILVINIKNGRTAAVLKIGGGKISKPFIKKDHMFIIKDNEIIKLK